MVTISNIRAVQTQLTETISVSFSLILTPGLGPIAPSGTVELLQLDGPAVEPSLLDGVALPPLLTFTAAPNQPPAGYSVLDSVSTQVPFGTGVGRAFISRTTVAIPIDRALVDPDIADTQVIAKVEVPESVWVPGDIEWISVDVDGDGQTDFYVPIREDGSIANIPTVGYSNVVALN